MIKKLAVRVGERLYTHEGLGGIVSCSEVTLSEMADKDDPSRTKFWLTTEYTINYFNGKTETVKEVKEWKPKKKPEYIIHCY